MKPNLEKSNTQKIEKETTLKDLKEKFPLLITSLAGSDEKDEQKVIEKCGDLLALAEIFEIENKVWEIGMHGKIPVMWVSVGKKDESGFDSGHMVKKIYNTKTKHIKSGQITDSYEFDNWDPQQFDGFEKIADALAGNVEGFESSKSGGYNYLSMTYPSQK